MIDKSTVAQILEAADIVEVVSDFVSLKRRGANYIGLCPFHNEKTPSFSVSKAKGICKCFSCGKGGSPVNFIMEHEQLSYYEALKYLAKKYHIEIKERELTDAEREVQSERESMLIINEFASGFFENQLHDTTEGHEIGLSYFYERGFSDITIKKFQLGYSPESRDALYKAAMEKGYNRKFLFSTGLCMENSHGQGTDRFRGRVMFPVLNVAGKVIAFGGRTLKKDLAKYVNSPESSVYKKSNELYGLFQAKQAIVKKEKCFLVEGYTDVISMHQAGIENVVASSGTSLTEGQIRLIHRFTDNVTVLYDGDAAGIKASLRGIDLLLAEGLNIKVMLLPDGDDPDSFARKHNALEFQQYIDENEVDFLTFKTRILLEGTRNDPIKRSAVISDIVKSIAVIPFQITQAVYIKECSRMLDIDEKVLLREVQKSVVQNKEKEFDRRKKENQESTVSTVTENTPGNPEAATAEDTAPIADKVGHADSRYNTILHPYEEEVIRYLIKYGMAELCLGLTPEGESCYITVLDYIDNELSMDAMQFSNPIFSKIYDLVHELKNEFDEDWKEKSESIEKWRKERMEEGIAEIGNSISDVTDIERKENILKETVNMEIQEKITEFRCNYFERIMCSHQDEDIRKMTLKLISEKHRLSKIHTKYAAIETEYSKLIKSLPQAIYNWKNGIVLCRIKDVQKKIQEAHKTNDNKKEMSLLTELQNMYSLGSELARYLGDRVVNPKK